MVTMEPQKERFAKYFPVLKSDCADDIHKYFHCFSEKIRLDVSSESSARHSARQRIHMKHQALFSLKKD